VSLRMVFERQDLQRVRLASGVDPMWELVISLQKAQTREVPAPFVAWRQALKYRLNGAVAGSRALALLSVLVPPLGDFPDFLTPPGLVTDIDAGCEALACTSPARLTTDLAALFSHRTPPTWVQSLAGGDRERIGEVVQAVRHGHDLLVAPNWADVQEVAALDRSKRMRILATHGVGVLLESLPGVLSWDGRVLRTRYPEDRTVHLAGRGLILVPSYFCWGNPITWIDPELPPVLVYQALGKGTRPRADVLIPERLVSLLGRTRAECLRVLLAPHSTSELAHQLDTSIGTASKQARVLRDAGLITSKRQGSAVMHATTSLGVALLIGDLPDY
jgi:DNA-binding transcriptional ArsR family regulator